MGSEPKGRFCLDDGELFYRQDAAEDGGVDGGDHLVLVH